VVFVKGNAVVADDVLTSVGNHFIIGLRPGPALDPRDRLLLRDLRPAGVILYKSNFHHDRPYEEWLAAHARLISDARAATGREKLFVAIDHEGGRVCRPPKPITRFSYARSWRRHAGDIGAAMGTELASLGVNLNFAPVLDIDSNPQNPVIGPRAFGDTAADLAEYGLSFLQQMEHYGVRGCGKHFPGHGDTRVDSHYELPIIDATIEELRDRELKPFSSAIRAGIGMIMTSHIVFKALDDARPCTLSPRIVNDLLRNELQFDGVIVSDDIGMRSANPFFRSPDAAARFMAAGNDLLMICSHWTDTELARLLARAMIEARDNGLLPRSTFERASHRIEAMLDRTPQHDVRMLCPEVFERHALCGPVFSEQTVEVV
jgi:beta-N-acetylhexosaminidase